MQYRRYIRTALLASIALTTQHAAAQQDGYRHFDAAIYTRYYEVQRMQDEDWLEQSWRRLSSDITVDRIYLETHRDRQLVDEATLERAIGFFRERGLEVVGGITLTISEPNRFETFCYSNPEHRAWVRQVVEFTARHFDEFILDDFFFTSCKSEAEIEARGERSWTEYRLELLAEAAGELIIGPAKAVNPDVKVVVKYPNWYEHFQGLGFNLERGPVDFDGIYTGTETRDAVSSAQHLQPYLGYNIFRYFDKLNPGHNGGGWVDTGGATSVDRYAEQLWLTLFAKAPEITLFDYRGIRNPVTERLRASWQDAGQGPRASFDYAAMMDAQRERGESGAPTFAFAAGRALAQADAVLGELGEPRGVAAYRPHHATGEDFLHNFLGMIGIPIDLRPAFPDEARTILLTESAKFDPDIVGKIERHIRAGGNVVVTSGLLAVLQERGLQRIAEVTVTGRKALVRRFLSRPFAPPSEIDEPMLIPQLGYLTNDSWELVSALSGPNGWPLLHDAEYGAGHLYLLAVPDNFADLYRLPADTLSALRQTIVQDMALYLDGPSGIAVFMYDNDTLIVESFRDEAAAIAFVGGESIGELYDVQSGERFGFSELPASGGFGSPRRPAMKRFALDIGPHRFRVLRYTKD